MAFMIDHHVSRGLTVGKVDFDQGKLCTLGLGQMITHSLLDNFDVMCILPD